MTGKICIVTKVFDDNCDLCKHMSKHDRATFENYGDVAYIEYKLDEIINHDNNVSKRKLYRILEDYCVSPTYEIDLPVYTIMSTQGKYLGHIQGSATVVELRDKLKECLEDTPE